MPTWVMYHSKWNWKAWLNSSLDEVIARKSPSLIIDIRGNTGGDDVGSFLLGRLKSSRDPETSFTRLVRYRRVPEDLLPYLSTWDDSFKNWGSSAVDLPEAWPTAPPVPYLRQDEQPTPETKIEPARERYEGQVYVLTDAHNSSATFGFARSIQQQRLGKLVGAPTGGNQRGINGGAFFFLTLPNSHLEIDLPLIGYFPPTAQPDEGLFADIPVTTTIKSIASRRDPVLAALERFQP